MNLGKNSTASDSGLYMHLRQDRTVCYCLESLESFFCGEPYIFIERERHSAAGEAHELIVRRISF